MRAALLFAEYCTKCIEIIHSKLYNTQISNTIIRKFIYLPGFGISQVLSRQSSKGSQSVPSLQAISYSKEK